MNLTLKRHLISAILTAIATFSTTFGTALMTVDSSNIDKAMIIGAVITAINVALRAFLKVLIEGDRFE